MMRLDINEIGGAVVDHGLSIGARFLVRGTRLSGDEVRSMFRTPNLKAMVDAGYLKVWPRGDGAAPAASEAKPQADIHVVYRGFGRYDVIEGVVRNEGALDKEGATELAKALRGAKH